MFEELEKVNKRPEPYERYTAQMLWNDEYISKKMLEFHLDEKNDIASRNKVFIDKAVEWTVSRFHVGDDTTICDFGCGPGLYAERFAERGADVTGIDFSENSIQHAKKSAEQKNLKINYILQDYLQFSADDKFDLITFIYLDLCPLSTAQRKTLLGIFYDCLKKEGSIILDVLSVNHFNSVNEKKTYDYSPKNGFWAPGPYYEFINTFKYDDELLILDKHTIVDKTRTREVFNWLQCYSPDSLRKEFEENGFQIEEHYSDISGTPYKQDARDIAIVAKKI